MLRETLQDNGIPFGWVQAEALQAIAPSREGIHVRFLICQWQPRLFTYCFAFQREFKARLLAIDPTARTWLMGFSWQYALPRGTAYPALPPAHIWAEYLAEVEALVRQARRSIGSLTFELSPPLLYDVGVVATAEWLVENLRQRYGLSASIERRGPVPELDETTRVTLYRALRELLLNVAKHSGTQEAHVLIEGDASGITLTVRDHGFGFDPKAPSGGFFDILHDPAQQGSMRRRNRSILDNAAMAESLVRLSYLSRRTSFYDEAIGALEAFASDYKEYGYYVAGYGRAIDLVFYEPLFVTIVGKRDAADTAELRRTALATYVAANSKGMAFNLPQSHPQEKTFYEAGKRIFFMRGGTHDFSCASCHGEDGKRIRLQDLPNLTKNPGDGVGFAAWPAYRVSNGQMWGMQLRLNDCYRQQRFPYPEFGSDALTALSTYLGVNAKGAKSAAPTIKR